MAYSGLNDLDITSQSICKLPKREYVTVYYEFRVEVINNMLQDKRWKAQTFICVLDDILAKVDLGWPMDVSVQTVTVSKTDTTKKALYHKYLKDIV